MSHPHDPDGDTLFECEGCGKWMDIDRQLAEEGLYGHAENLCHGCMVDWLDEQASRYARENRV